MADLTAATAASVGTAILVATDDLTAAMAVMAAAMGTVEDTDASSAAMAVTEGMATDACPRRLPLAVLHRSGIFGRLPIREAGLGTQEARGTPSAPAE